MKFLTKTSGGKCVALNDQVSVRKVQEHGHTVIAVVNGTNLWKFNPASYSAIVVARRDDGSHQLVGTGNGASTGVGPEGEVMLASFPSAEIAARAHCAVVQACTAAPAGRRRWLKWGAFAGAGYLLLSLLFGSLGGHAVAAVDLPVAAAPAQPAGVPPSGGTVPVAQTPGFDPTEPTLEELAAGKYQFKPKIQAPDVQAPELNCAPKKQG